MSAPQQTLTDVQAMMAGCGPQIPEVDVITQSPDGDEWALQLDDDSVVYVRYDESHQRIQFATDVGRPDFAHRMRTLESLLIFNILWRGELSVRMALSPDVDDRIMQMCVLPVSAVDPESLPPLVVEFSRLARAWRESVASGCQDNDGAVIALQFSANAIRV